MELTDNISSEQLERLMDLYESAFPPDERRPREQMPPADPAFRLWAVGDDGLLTTWHFDGYTYVEHFAVFPDRRGGGIGSRALAAIEGPVILEVEPPESGEMARRRIDFYRRNGFRLEDLKYIQPPYSPASSPASSPVELRLMVRGQLPVPLAEAAATLRRRVYLSPD